MREREREREIERERERERESEREREREKTFFAPMESEYVTLAKPTTRATFRHCLFHHATHAIITCLLASLVT